MTQQSTAVARPKPPIMAGGSVAALVPQSLDEAFRVANAIAASGLAPKGIDKPEQVLVAIMAGAELGFAPFQAMQSFAVINGKPNIWGDAIPALLWSNGFKIKEWFDNEDEPTKAFCLITRPDGEEIQRTFSIADAKKANLVGKQGPWQTNQKRMLQMRARGFAARDGASDILRGLQVAEEVRDYGPVRDVTPQTTGMRARLEARGSSTAPGFNADQVSAEMDDQVTTNLKACEVCGAEEGVECADDCSSWDELDPSSWPDSVRNHRAPNNDFPGDPKPSTGAGDEAGPAEAEHAVEGTGPASDSLEVWRVRLIEDMDGLSAEQLDHLLANPSDQEMFAELEATQPQLALDLNKAITRRRREIAA